MACKKFNQSWKESCLNGLPGVTTIYIASKSDLTGFALNTAGDTITGITMATTGKTFYELKLSKQVGSSVETAKQNLINGVSLSTPKIVGKIPGMNETTRAIFDQLKEAETIAVVKLIDGKLFAIGWNNGLNAEEASFGTEAQSDGFAGVSFTLSGIEPTAGYFISSALNFASTYVN